MARLMAFGWVAPVLVVALAASETSAAYRMCAFRDGPRGACTCKGDTDGPGQFTVTSKSRCSPAVPADAQKADAGAVGPVTPPAAGAPTAASPPAAPVVRDITPTPPPAATPESSPAAAPTTTAGTPAPAAEPAATAADAAPPPGQAASTAPVRKLDEIRARGKILCGVNTGLLGFSAQSGSGTWGGLDVDFCRAVAAAVFGDASKVDFVPLETNERFDALTTGKIDILSRNTTWTMNREIDLGFRFAGVLYFDGQGFMTSDERGLVSAQQLAGSKVCVEAGTTSEKNMAYYFNAQQIDAVIQTFATRDEMLKAYGSGACDAYSGDQSALFSDRASFAEPMKHTILPEIISKEPLGPLVLKADDEWAEIVRWTLAGLINAEEVGLGKASATSSEPLGDDARRLIDGAAASGDKLRLSKSWLRDAVAAVGNYGEMFDANVGAASPLGMARGINALWKSGGILYAPPMW